MKCILCGKEVVDAEIKNHLSVHLGIPVKEKTIQEHPTPTAAVKVEAKQAIPVETGQTTKQPDPPQTPQPQQQPQQQPEPEPKPKKRYLNAEEILDVLHKTDMQFPLKQPSE